MTTVLDPCCVPLRERATKQETPVVYHYMKQRPDLLLFYDVANKKKKIHFFFRLQKETAFHLLLPLEVWRTPLVTGYTGFFFCFTSWIVCF